MVYMRLPKKEKEHLKYADFASLPRSLVTAFEFDSPATSKKISYVPRCHQEERTGRAVFEKRDVHCTILLAEGYGWGLRDRLAD